MKVTVNLALLCETPPTLPLTSTRLGALIGRSTAVPAPASSGQPDNAPYLLSDLMNDLAAVPRRDKDTQIRSLIVSLYIFTYPSQVLGYLDVCSAPREVELGQTLTSGQQGISFLL